MKSLIGLGALLLLVACNNKTENGFGKLTPEEQDWARQVSYEKCISESAEDFAEYKKLSAEFFRDRVRGDSHTYTLKIGTEEIENQVVTIWKKTTDTIYFVNTRTDVDNNVTYQFIKYPLATNHAIIDDLQVKKCKTTDELEVTEHQTSASITRTNIIPGGTHVYLETVSTFSVDYPSPAYFYPFQESRKVRNLDAARAEQGTPKSYAGSIGVLTTVTPNANYTDYTASKRRYCVIKVANAGPPVEYVHPLALDCRIDADPSGDPPGWTNPTADL